LNPSHIKIEFKNIGTAVLLERHENKLLKTMKAQFLTKKNSNISESSKAIKEPKISALSHIV
jgi:ABC-type ATPase involved in cell division